MLLRQGMDVNAVDNAGCTPLIHAAIFCQHRVIPVLFEYGANVLFVGPYGWTALEGLVRPSVHGWDRRLSIVAVEAELLSKAKLVAFAMGLHERLGAGSRVRWLDEGVLRMVLGPTVGNQAGNRP
jgi:hypothetical protein